MSSKLFVKGNEAVAMAAVEAGCRYYFGYPITPQSDIPEYLSRELPRLGGVHPGRERGGCHKHAAGGLRCRRALHDLILRPRYLAQAGGYLLHGRFRAARGDCGHHASGPRSGGIDASQADYWQATRGGGHGGYRIIVLAPNSVQEMYDLTMLAFDLSDLYRIPAMVLADSVIGQMKESIVANPRPVVDLPVKDWAVRGRQEGRRSAW